MAKKCPEGCVCGKHARLNLVRKEKVASLPCLNCGTVRMVFPCYAPDAPRAPRYCDRSCFTEHQQKRMAARRARGDSRKYDMKRDEFEARLAKQGGRCAICSKKIVGKDAHRDHCHTTGEWRGLLCSNCNLGIGLLQDDPDVLFCAWQYLILGGVVHEPAAAVS